MKNLYIIPTDKPSRLRYTYGNNYALSRETLSWRYAHHIYIISDEEILEGDYWFNLDNNEIKNGELYGIANNAPSCRKIILTTDQDLIKVGVQAIDDDFLRWFVENPKIERVNIDKHQFSNNIIVYSTVKQFIEDKWKELENSNLDTPLRSWDNIIYTEKEVKILFEKYFETQGCGEYQSMDFNDWFNSVKKTK